MNTNHVPVLCICLFLFVSCNNSTSSRADGRISAAQQEEELHQQSREWDRLFDAADATQLASLYADDAISMPPDSPTVQGRRALQTEFESFFASNVARHETMVDKIVIEGDLAIEVARYRLTYRPKSGGPEVVESGRHMESRRRTAGKWRIVLEIWNRDTPLPK